MSKIRVVMVASSLSINGISSVIFNYAEELNMDEFDLVIVAGTPIANKYQEIADKIGATIIELPSRKRNSFRFYTRLYKILKSNQYDIFHIHGNSSSMAVELLIAKLSGIKIRIAHSHNTKCDFKAHKLLLPIFRCLYTEAFACGQRAGEWLFGKRPFYVMRNGFDVEKFRFSIIDREQVRSSLNISEKFVIGHIGRINYQKNQDYLLDIFEIAAKKRRDLVLVMIGSGPDEEKIRERVSRSKFKDRIILYGETNTPEKMYMAMDMMVFPSRYEGLPVTLIEAQISGLPCLVSSSITDEVFFTDEIRSLSIEESPEIWADKVMEATFHESRYEDYLKYNEDINKYNIKNCVIDLEDEYRSLCYE